jgi:hypothetical protein
VSLVVHETQVENLDLPSTELVSLGQLVCAEEGESYLPYQIINVIGDKLNSENQLPLSNSQYDWDLGDIIGGAVRDICPQHTSALANQAGQFQGNGVYIPLDDYAGQ